MLVCVCIETLIEIMVIYVVNLCCLFMKEELLSIDSTS